MMRRWFAFLTLLVLAAPHAYAAEEIPPSPIVKAQLVVDAPLVKKGTPVDAAVIFTMPEHWHIYWKNPGDSGIPTSLEWTLPNGLTAGEIEWPAPDRIDTSGIINYGYGKQVTLPVKLTPGKDDVTGEVKVKASWLVCKDSCIPESADLTAMLNGNNAEAANIIAAARLQVPKPFTGKAAFDATAQAVTLTITRDNPWGAADDARFSPVEDGLMANTPFGEVKHVGNELTFTLPRGTADVFNTWHGVLSATVDGKLQHWDITAANNTPLAEKPADAEQATEEPHESICVEDCDMNPTWATHFGLALMLAFIGGLILNIMPCVLPILALKALALVKKAQVSRGAAAKQGISYTAGVIVSFLVIAGIMLALKASGAAIGWGYQLQNPGFVAFLALIMALVSANLLGMFELPVLFGEKATGVDDSTLRGSFLTGTLAVLVATPCTAPFMAPAIGATLVLSTGKALAVFAMIGLGMASPFLLISLWPAARRMLPKPGKWMNSFKKILALPMLATCAWLCFVLYQLMTPPTGANMYSAARLQELRTSGKPVLVDATAAWCLSCKVNERVALKPADMQQFFKEKNVVILTADWTKSDPAITEFLASFKRNGVPLYVYYPANRDPVILPQLLTPSIVRNAIIAADTVTYE